MSLSSNHVVSDASERCILYLLGELSADQATAFESDLEQSKQLQDELLAQSHLLCSLPSNQSITVAAHSTRTHAAWPLVTTIAALAACLTIAFFAWPRTSDTLTTSVVDAAPEKLLIARAWADAPLGDLISDWNDQVIEADDALLPPAEDDSALSWMVAAAEAGAVIDG